MKDIVINTLNKFPSAEVNNDLTAVYNELKIVIENNEAKSDMDLSDIERLKDSLRLMSKYIPDDNKIIDL